MYKSGYDILGLPTTLLESHDEGGDENNEAMSTSSSNFSIPSTDMKKLESWIAEDTRDEKNILNLTGRAPDSFIHAMLGGDEEDSKLTVMRADRHLDPLIDTGRQALIHKVRENEPSSFIFKGDHEIPQVEHLIDEQIRGFCRTKRKKKPTPYSLLKRRKNLSPRKIKQKKQVTIQELRNLETKRKKLNEGRDEEELLMQTMGNTGVMLEMCQMQPLHKLWCYFPWWFVYVAYAIAWFTICTLCYFTVVWSLNFGYLRSLDWLTHVCMSFFHSLCIIQPMRVYAMSFIYAAVFKVWDGNHSFDKKVVVNKHNISRMVSFYSVPSFSMKNDFKYWSKPEMIRFLRSLRKSR